MLYQIHGSVTVSCCTEVEADSEEGAIEIANSRTMADVRIEGGYDVDEYWHLDSDDTPEITNVEQ
jgi:hypothetical protein